MRALHATAYCTVVALVLAAPACGPKRPATPVARPRVAGPTRPPTSKAKARAGCPPLPVPKTFTQTRLDKGKFTVVPRTAEAARLVPVITRRIDQTVRDLVDSAKSGDVVPKDLCPIRIDKLTLTPAVGAYVELIVSLRREELSIEFSMDRQVPPKGARAAPEKEWKVGGLLQVLDLNLLREAMTSWLGSHPEVLSISEDKDLDVEGLDDVGFHWRWVRTTRGSMICIRSDQPLRPSTWCWQEKRPIEHVALGWQEKRPIEHVALGRWVFLTTLHKSSKKPAKPTAGKDQEGDADGEDKEGDADGEDKDVNDTRSKKRPATARDPIEGFVDIRLAGGGREVWVVRLPSAERVLVGKSSRSLETDIPTPFWFAEAPKRTPKRKPNAADLADLKLTLAARPTAGFARFPTVPELYLGALRRVEVKPIRSMTPGLWALELTEEVTGSDSLRRRSYVCVRWPQRWSCADPMTHDFEDEAIVTRDYVYRIPSKGAKDRFAIQTCSKEHGGNGAGSGGNGTADLDIYELGKGELSWLGSLKIGEMAWTTVLFNDASEGDDRHYERLTSSYTHLHEAAGEDCLRFGKTMEVHAWATGEFSRLRAAPRDKKTIRLKAPSLLPLEENRFKLPVPSDKALKNVDENEPWRITVVPLTGLWRLQPKTLVRVSANPKGDCPPPKTTHAAE